MENPLFFLVLGLMVAWVGSYFYSMQYNRRKLTILGRWLQEALTQLGGRVSSRWTNQDTLSISINDGRGRIKEVLVVLAAQRRDLYSMLISLVRGGKDSMSFVLALNPPTRAGAEFEIFKKGTPVPKAVLLGLGGVKDWAIEDYSRNALYQIAARTEATREMASRLITLLLDDGYDIRRVSIRPTTPHMMLVFDIPGLPQADAHDLVQLIRNLADEVSSTPPPSRIERPSPPAPKKRMATRLPTLNPESKLPLSGKHHAQKPEGPSLN
jgi:hypothetical protein